MIRGTVLHFTILIAMIFVELGYSATLPAQPGCVQDPLYRIINGTAALLNMTKHQVSLRDRDMDLLNFGFGHLCGGSLVSNNVVLCAAHCFLDHEADEEILLPKTDFVVVMGNLQLSVKDNNTLLFDIKHLLKYNDRLNTATHDDDIVILILNGTVPFDHPTVQPIELNAGPLEEGTECQVTGWGRTETGLIPQELRTTDVPIISLDNCRHQTVYGQRVHEGMLCAGYMKGERDACQGDSGGPLVCNGLQAGIVSWGQDCGKPNQPGVYTNVAFYRHWILSKVVEYNATLPKFVDKSSGKKPGGDAMSTYNGSVVLICLMTALITFISQF